MPIYISCFTCTTCLGWKSEKSYFIATLLVTEYLRDDGKGYRCCRETYMYPWPAPVVPQETSAPGEGGILTVGVV